MMRISEVTSSEINFKTAPTIRQSSGPYFYDSGARTFEYYYNQYGTDKALTELGIYQLSALDTCNNSSKCSRSDLQKRQLLITQWLHPLYESARPLLSRW